MIKNTLVLVLALAAGCGDDGNNKPPVDSGGSGSDGSTTMKTWVQIEQLARPGVNEALLFSNDYLNGYNATAPSFKGVDPATLGKVVGEAKTVLKALYLGSCLLDGALGLTPQTGLHPAGMECNAVGGALWTENSLAGVTLTQASQTAAQAYADKVFGQFEPDVMRVDTSVTSEYLTLCGDANSAPLLCGGRFLNNDVIDVTYNYFLAGAAVTKGPFDQVHALVGDGVEFSTTDANNVDSVTLADPKNPQQFHPNVSQAFPYSANPF